MKNVFYIMCIICLGCCFTNITYSQNQKSYDIDEIKNLDSLKPKYKGYFPEAGFVPDKETAIKIALAVWIPIYGKQQILEQKPYRVTLKDTMWIVEGSLPKGYDGGVAYIEIRKKDCTVLKVSHGK